MKKIIFNLVDFYISPLKWSASLSLFAKHRIMQHNEHLLAAVHMIKRIENKIEGDVIDVGAFNGSTSIFFAKNFPGLKVTGFEPNPATFPQAKKNCENYPGISLKQVAVDQEEGELDFFVSDNNLSSSLNRITDNEQFSMKQQIKVKVMTLDGCLESVKLVLLIKLDTQGRELKIMTGGTQTLKKTKYILTEMNNHNYYENGCQYYQVDAFLREHKFKLVNISSGYNYAGMTEYDALYKNTEL
ncbi:MAG: FkbM family methyltransferase [Bacteroidota bacterium]